MKLCVVNEGKVQKDFKLPECDVALFGFGSLGEVDYQEEIAGKSFKLEEAARLSKNADCALFCGCVTIVKTHARKSVCVCERGKLAGITDSLFVMDNENFKSGAGVGVYSACGYKVGLCVENDLLFPEVIKTLSLCGCNLVVAVLSELKNAMPPLLIRAYAYLYGVPVLMCAGKTAYFADTAGVIATSKQDVCLFETDIKNDYHVVSTRVRGKTCCENSDF